MIIKLSPQVANKATQAPVISLSGLNLKVGDKVIDLSMIPVGGQAEADETSPLIGVVTREEVTVRYPYSTDVYEASQPTDPAVYEFDLLDGQTLNCPLIKRGA